MSMDDALCEVFTQFCSFGAGQSGSDEMDSAKFLKLSKDTGLVGKDLSSTDLDLIFSKVKGSGSKRISYPTFKTALGLVAEKKGVDVDTVVQRVINARGPSVTNTTSADAVRFHDDPNTYTGTHSVGGPTTTDHRISLSSLADRSDADARGVQMPAIASASSPKRLSGTTPSANSPPAQRLSVTGNTSPSAQSPVAAQPRVSLDGSSAKQPRKSSTSPSPERRVSNKASAAVPMPGNVEEERVSGVFYAFCSSVNKPSSEADSSKFMKLCTDCGLLDRQFTRTQADLLFTKVAQQKRMSFATFRSIAVPMIAAEKGCSPEEVLSMVASTNQMSSSGTVAQATRLHDDQSTYTGVHTAGGPTTQGGGSAFITLSNLADRSDADVRGVQTGGSPGRTSQSFLPESPRRQSGTTSPARRPSSKTGSPARP